MLCPDRNQGLRGTRPEKLVAWCRAARRKGQMNFPAEVANPMTEDEWIECEVPDRLVQYLPLTESVRKERLFACAC